jgi:hypothetical protein
LLVYHRAALCGPGRLVGCLWRLKCYLMSSSYTGRIFSTANASRESNACSLTVRCERAPDCATSRTQSMPANLGRFVAKHQSRPSRRSRPPRCPAPPRIPPATLAAAPSGLPSGAACVLGRCKGRNLICAEGDSRVKDNVRLLDDVWAQVHVRVRARVAHDLKQRFKKKGAGFGPTWHTLSLCLFARSIACVQRARLLGSQCDLRNVFRSSVVATEATHIQLSHA